MSNEITKAMFLHRRAYDLIGDAITLSREIDNPFIKTGFFYRIQGHDEQGPFASPEVRDRSLIAAAETQARLEWVANQKKSGHSNGQEQP
jgi:hypothetical protein